jgi:hypothetical protein
MNYSKLSILASLSIILALFLCVKSQEPYFYLYSQSNKNNFNILSIGDSNSLRYLDPFKNYIFVIHGFNSHVNKTYWQSFKDAILEKVFN